MFQRCLAFTEVRKLAGFSFVNRRAANCGAIGRAAAGTDRCTEISASFPNGGAAVNENAQWRSLTQGHRGAVRRLDQDFTQFLRFTLSAIEAASAAPKPVRLGGIQGTLMRVNVQHRTPVMVSVALQTCQHRRFTDATRRRWRQCGARLGNAVLSRKVRRGYLASIALPKEKFGLLAVTCAS